MIGIKAEAVVVLDDLEPGLIIIAERQLVAIEMIEDAEFHAYQSSIIRYR